MCLKIRQKKVTPILTRQPHVAIYQNLIGATGSIFKLTSLPPSGKAFASGANTTYTNNSQTNLLLNRQKRLHLVYSILIRLCHNFPVLVVEVELWQTQITFRYSMAMVWQYIYYVLKGVVYVSLIGTLILLNWIT
jgi:hypothetical protein